MNCWNSSGISEEFQRFHLFQSFSSHFPRLQWNSTGIPPERWKDFLVGYPVESVKYLGVKIDSNLNWLFQVNDLSVKLNRANTLLFKIRKYDSPKTLRSINFAIGLRVLELFN